MQCNICGSASFDDYRGRPSERCSVCGSKARHRVALEVYKRFLDTDVQQRVLHLAPEKSLVPALKGWFETGYVTADPEPDRYPHTQCLKLFFPQDYDIFPDGYFNVILHNHVMEHIPGSYKDHLEGFVRMLAPKGQMIISVPGPYMDRQTVEGGEHLETDEERLEKFLQEDHLKLFGHDFVDYLADMPGGRLIPDGITDEFRASVSVRKGKAPFFIWQKD